MVPGVSGLGRIASLIEVLLKHFKSRSEKQEESSKRLALVPTRLAAISSFCGLNGTLKYATADVDACRKAVTLDHAGCLEVIAEIHQVLDGDPRVLRALDKMQELLDRAYVAQCGCAGFSNGMANSFSMSLVAIQSEITPHLETVRQSVESKRLSKSTRF